MPEPTVPVATLESRASYWGFLAKRYRVRARERMSGRGYRVGLCDGLADALEDAAAELCKLIDEAKRGAR